jgi:protein-S-isoprenylcysteine O-methyltransferase Ste14
MLSFIFALACYIMGISSISAFFWYIQFQIDKNPEPFSWVAIGMNSLLFLLFPLQHSFLPRPKVKDWIQKHFSESLERSLYVGTSGIAMWIIILAWKRIGPVLFVADNTLLIEIVFYTSLLLIIYCTIILDHSRMFGLKQGYYAWKGKELLSPKIQKSGIYGVVRHPITSLLVVCLWSHSSLTVGRLQLNLLFTIYAIAGTVLEERDLLRKFGAQYQAYRNQVPSFIPFWK